MTFTIDMITIDTTDPHRLAGFWTKALGASIEHDSEWFVILAPAGGDGVRLGLQRVDDPTPGKNRMHFDTHVADRVAEVERLIGLGATEVGEHSVPGLTWTVLADPEGNQFCIAQES